MGRIQDFLKDTGGSTAIEYAMVAGFVSIAILAALTQIGTKLQQKFYIQVGTGLN